MSRRSSHRARRQDDHAHRTRDEPAADRAVRARLIWVNGAPVTCEGYDLVAASAALHELPRAAPRRRRNNSVRSRHTPLPTQNNGSDRRFHQDREAERCRRVERRHAGDPQPGHWRSEPGGLDCGDPTPDAVLRIQRLRDNGNIGTGTGALPVCTYADSQNPHDWWPNALYDAREGNYRPTGTGVATTSLMNARRRHQLRRRLT